MDANSTLATLGTVGEFLLEQFGLMSESLLEIPLALIGVGFFVIGGSIGLVKRIIR